MNAAPLLAAGDIISHLTNSYELHFGALTLDLNQLVNFRVALWTGGEAVMGTLVHHGEEVEGIVAVKGGFNPHVTKHVVMMFLAACFTAFAAILTARVADRKTGRRFFPSMIEWVVVWLRDEVIGEGIHDAKNRRRYFPLLATLFFFILSCNLIGLLPPPFGSTATGNVNITAGLALVTLTTMLIGGMIEKGPVKFWIGLVPHGVPLALWPLVFVIECVGLVTKPFALTVRLFANMTAGHVMLAVLGGFLLVGGPTLGAWLTNKAMAGIPSLAFYLFINTFEVLIALIQAYIFTILSSIFVGMMISHEH